MDRLTKEQRRKSMQGNKATGSKIEVALAKMLYARGHRYRKNNKSVFGKPDLTFKKIKLAIFVDGEFWHGKDWKRRKDQHVTNKDFWIKKIERNIQRDKEVNAELTKQGWHILRFWGTEIEKNLLSCVLEIETAIANLTMDLKEEISLEEIEGRQFKIRIVESKGNKDAVLQNGKNEVSRFYKKDAVRFTKEILEYKYPEEEITLQAAEEALQYGIYVAINPKEDKIPHNTENHQKITREDIMKFFQDTEKLNELTIEDRVEILKTILLGSSDFNKELFDEIFPVYSIIQPDLTEKK